MSYRTRRTKLKRHDAGHDRHNKTVAYENKKARLATQHQTQRSTRSARRRKS